MGKFKSQQDLLNDTIEDLGELLRRLLEQGQESELAENYRAIIKTLATLYIEEVTRQ